MPVVGCDAVPMLLQAVVVFVGMFVTVAVLVTINDA